MKVNLAASDELQVGKSVRRPLLMLHSKFSAGLNCGGGNENKMREYLKDS